MLTEPVVSGALPTQRFPISESERTPIRFWEIAVVIGIAAVVLLLKLAPSH